MSEPVHGAQDSAQASLRNLTTRYLDLLDSDVRAWLRGLPPAAPTQQAQERSLLRQPVEARGSSGRPLPRA